MERSPLHDLAVRPIAVTDPAEVEAVVRMWRASREHAQPWLEARMGHTPAEDLGFFRGTVLSGCDVYVAFERDQPLGLLAVQADRIEHLYVAPEHQGAGVGSTLLELAKRLSPGGITLFTHRRNQRAREFYERRGFRLVRLGVSAPPESEPDVEYRFSSG